MFKVAILWPEHGAPPLLHSGAVILSPTFRGDVPITCHKLTFSCLKTITLIDGKRCLVNFIKDRQCTAFIPAPSSLACEENSPKIRSSNICNFWCT